MDQRYHRLRYFLAVSRKTMHGMAYFESWHRFGSYRKQREDRYKNKNRATIRRSP